MMAMTQPPTLDLFAAWQLAPPWWATLGGNLAAAAVARATQEAEARAHEAEAQARRLATIAQRAQVRLDTMPPRDGVECLPLPTDPSACDGEGICPIFGCVWNLVLDVRRSVRVVEADRHGLPLVVEETETIVVGGRGGHGEGESLAARRNAKGKVPFAQLERLAEAAVARAESLPATCLWDYIRDQDLIPSRYSEADEDGESGIRPHMTLAQIAEVLGVTREAIRIAVGKALFKLRQADGIETIAEGFFVPASRLTRREEP